MSVAAGGADGFGPFDEQKVLGVTEYGGGAGLIEGSPNSQSGKMAAAGRFAGGADHVAVPEETMPVDEKIGVEYRAVLGDDGVWRDPVSGLAVEDVQ